MSNCLNAQAHAPEFDCSMYAAVQVAVWMLWSTVSLIQAVRYGTVQSHPMFYYAQQQQRSPPSPSPGDISSHRARMLGLNPNYSAPV